MRRIFLIRHGEPVAGWGEEAANPGLSANGKAQAQLAGEALQTKGALAVVSSPMLRCLETATPFQAMAGAALRIEPRVSEVVAPAGVADRRAWLRECFPWAPGSAPRAWASLDPTLVRWRGETLAAIRELTQDTAVFTHFIAINAIVTEAMNSPHTIGCRPGFASVTELALHGNGRLDLVALGEEMRTDDVR